MKTKKTEAPADRLTIRLSELPAVFTLVEQLRQDVDALYALLKPRTNGTPA